MVHAKFLISPLIVMIAALCDTRHVQAEQPRNITFETIKFEMKKDDSFERKLLTPAIENLVGKKIRIRGWIYSTGQAKGLTDFVLVRHNLECCFGPGAMLFDCIVVKLDAGVMTDYTNRLLTVDGIFDVREEKFPDGTWAAIYHLSGEQVK